MPAPFRVNFTIRPAKNIERKMLRDVFSHLWPFAPVSSYRYVGFGSKFFTDFSLFHRTLGITEAVSIEQDAEHGERYDFNKPFNSIELILGESNDVLPALTWDTRTIAWLDYNSKLRNSELLDVRFFCSSAPPGSVLAVTVNVHPDDLRPKDKKSRLIKLRERIVDLVKIPVDIQDKDLSNWGLASASRRIITNEIQEALAERNSARDAEMRYQQLFNFHYQDNAQMLTLGGVIYREDQEALVASRCGFQRLKFFRPGPAHYEIRAPDLTLREIRHLDKQLPTLEPDNLDAPGVDIEDLRAYADVYRYYPAFAETEV